MKGQQTLFATCDPPMQRDAVLGMGGTYRYLLGRRWAPGGTAANFLMLNPSRADAYEDDPTIRRCIAFARGWGHNALIVTNLFAARSTDPDALKGYCDPIGPENDNSILWAARTAAVVVCAWGAHPFATKRAEAVLAMLRSESITPHCLALTKDGAPGHPLYLKSDRRPVPMLERTATP